MFHTDKGSYVLAGVMVCPESLRLGKRHVSVWGDVLAKVMCKTAFMPWPWS